MTPRQPFAELALTGILLCITAGNVIGTATVVNGSWSITPTTALPNGTYTLTATATDAAGNISGSSNSISFTVNTTPLVASNEYRR